VRERARRATNNCTFGPNLLSRLATPLPATSYGTGWRYIRQDGAFRDKPGLVASGSGAHLKLMLTEVKAEGQAASSPSSSSSSSCVAVHLVHLRSYEHMGMAQLSCSGACTCANMTIDGHLDRRYSLEDTAPPLAVCPVLTFTPHAECCLDAVVLPRTHSGQHTVKITGLVVTPASGSHTGIGEAEDRGSSLKASLKDVQHFVDYSSKGEFRAFSRPRAQRQSFNRKKVNKVIET
jgi:hypothetical protein